MLAVIQHIEENKLMNILKEGKASLIGYSEEQIKDIINIINLKEIESNDGFYWKG